MVYDTDALQMKIDLHTHILPREWPDLDARYGYPGFVRLDHYKPCCARMMIGDRVFREITDNVWDPKQRLEEMDREKITMQVLSTVPVMFSYWAKPHDALDFSRRLNDHIAEVVRDHPKRFAGLATIPMQDPDLAAAELERCIRELGLRGAEIGTHVDANPHFGRIDTLNLACDLLDDLWRRIRPLPEAARRLCPRWRRLSVYGRPHRTCVSRASRPGRDRQQHEPAKISRSQKQKGRSRPCALLRGLPRPRWRCLDNAAQVIWRATHCLRIGLSVSARRST